MIAGLENFWTTLKFTIKLQPASQTGRLYVDSDFDYDDPSNIPLTDDSLKFLVLKSGLTTVVLSITGLDYCLDIYTTLRAKNIILSYITIAGI